MVRIGNRWVGEGQPTYVVAELSANHLQDYHRAVALVAAAAEAGADAVKLQTYTADTMTIDCDLAPFRIGGGTVWDGLTEYGLYTKSFTPWDWHADLQAAAKAAGIDFFSTAFDSTAVAFLESLKVPAHKIASFELVDPELLRCVAATGKPVILSTGMADRGEIEEALATLREAGCTQAVLLKCVSNYPALPRDMNLRTIPDMAETFGVPAGLSDHTLTVAVAAAAVALGACMVEKHLTLSRKDGGPDSAFSLEPDEFREMVETIRMTEQALGTVSYVPSEAENRMRAYRRSLFVVEDLAAGDEFTRDNVRAIRPGHGLAPKHLDRILGRRAACDIARGTPLREDLVD